MLRTAVRARHLLTLRALYPTIRIPARCSRSLTPLSLGRSMHSWSSEIVHHGNEENREFPERTHTCGELNMKENGKTVVLCGWAQAVRSISNDLLFIPLRDAYGTTQLVFRTENCSSSSAANALREKINALTPESVPKEEVRMKHRYLDLRRPELQKNIRTRSLVASTVRNYLNDNHFVEVETPVLFKSTPEGAREYVVPTRNRGQFYALPQSPQQHKQMLMAAGIDRYYQIARCFRDEDLRADRQPEFTQIDLEMSFIKAKDIQNIIEGMVSAIWKKALDVQLSKMDFPHMTYNEAMSKYGSDKPDIRFNIHINDISKQLPTSAHSGVLECMVVKKGAALKTSDVRAILQEYESQNGDVNKLHSIKITEKTRESWLSKCVITRQDPNLSASQTALNEELQVEQGDLVYIHQRPKYLYGGNTALGRVRLHMSRLLQDANVLSINPNDYKFLWIESFPLFTPDEAGIRTWQATHHPFTAPYPEDLPLLETDPAKVRGQHYDLVLNGMEIGGGSIRIHYPELQRFIFDKVLELQPFEYKRFDHLLEALAGGCPPHGGIALGFDRLMSIICGTPSIRDVIAFPKAGGGKDLVVDSPSELTKSQLAEYGLELKQ
ncbi:hypothetical protein NQZ79_g2979 [Umbelopsis isabellina]|nr:hypothetical protein NQZ79_g2979 [Umbelopsis isabellina]